MPEAVSGAGDGAVRRLICADTSEPRLDRFLSASLPAMSRARLQSLIRGGAVAVDGVRTDRPSSRLRPGAEVAVELRPQPPSELTPENIPLDVLYEDDDLAAINKPAGLVVHAGAGHPRSTLVNALLFRYGALSETGGAARPGIVHRLDRFTSGVMVIARNDFAHRRLAEQFQRREAKKTYVALVHGRLPARQGEIRLPIHRDPRHRVRMTTRLRSGREAHTGYRVVEEFPAPELTPKPLRSACSYSWLELDLHTGRTHQIRVHLAALGHPVVGDRLYGAPAVLAGPGTLTEMRIERVLLHARRLELNHPRTGSPMSFVAPLPAEMESLAAQLQAKLVRI